MVFPVLLSINEWRKKSKNHPDADIEKLLGQIYDAETIYKRFDKLIELLHHCEQQPAENSLYRQLSSSTLAILGHIVDVENEETIREKIAARELVRQYDPYYMPWARPELSDVNNDPLAICQSYHQPAQLGDIFSAFIQDLRTSSSLLTYGGRNNDNFSWASSSSEIKQKIYNECELETFRALPNKANLIKLVTLNNGDNRRLTFDFLNTSNLAIKAYDHLQRQSETFLETAIYTVHTNGSFFIGRSLAPERTSLFDPKAILHPSYADSYSGLPLFMAGQIKISNGRVQLIDGASGHFAPDYEQTTNAISFFKKSGLVNNQTLLAYYRYGTDHQRLYTNTKCTQLEAMLADFCTTAKIDSRQVTAEFLKKEAPETYTKYFLQSTINNAFVNWKASSKVFFDNPSLQTARLDVAVERLSKFGDYEQPELTLRLLHDVSIGIKEWLAYHQSFGITSRRQGAVNQLEKQVAELALCYASFVYLKNHAETFTGSFKTIVNDFLSYKIDLRTMIETIRKSRNKSGFQFFPEGKTGKQRLSEEISTFLKLLCDVKTPSVILHELSQNKALYSEVNNILNPSGDEILLHGDNDLPGSELRFF